MWSTSTRVSIRVSKLGRVHQVRDKAVDVICGINEFKAPALVETLVHQSHGLDTLLGFFHHLDRYRVGQVLGLEQEKPGDDLHVVLYPVMDFLDHHILLPQRSLKSGCGEAQVGDIKVDPDP